MNDKIVLPERGPRLKFCPLCRTELEARSINDAERQVCPADGCGFVFWDNPVPVVAAIVEHEECIVLANNVGWPDHLFGLVTGFLEKNESPAEAVLREVREELGLEGVVESFVGHYPFEAMNQIIMAYHVRGTGEIRLGEELRAIRRIERAKLKPWRFGTGLAVRDWLRAQGIATEE
jgi:NAD+ diphosphatase